MNSLSSDNKFGYFFRFLDFFNICSASLRTCFIRYKLSKEFMAISGIPDCLMPINCPGPLISKSFCASANPSSNFARYLRRSVVARELGLVNNMQ